ncbi:hypothetical protein M434DRAFT_31976 [Hypoxylon sp. CO27-5]|nr:hypothetical protein M434DRAFT_31976 [Hypoxylon sp. CO27-5]
MLNNGSGSPRGTTQVDSRVNQGNIGIDPDFPEEWLETAQLDGISSGWVGCTLPTDITSPQGPPPYQDAITPSTDLTSLAFPNVNWDSSVVYTTQSAFTLSPNQYYGDLCSETQGNSGNWTAHFTANGQLDPMPTVVSGQNGYGFQKLNTAQPTDISAVAFASGSRNSPHCCDICKKVFTKNNDLIRHQESVHSRGGPTYRCICGYSQIRKDNYKRHVESCKKEDILSSYSCKCTKEHNDKSVHLDHVKSCDFGFHGPPGRPSRP